MKLAISFVVFVWAMLWILVAASLSVVGATNTSRKDGNAYDAVGGAWHYSTRYENGIVLEGSSWAEYTVSVRPGSPCTYELRLGIFYSQVPALFASGPSLSAWNWETNAWDLVRANLGEGYDRFREFAVSPATYISTGGSVRLSVTTDSLDSDVAIAYVQASWDFDATPPSNPDSNVADPTTGPWTRDNTIRVEWAGAADDKYSIGGYSIEWSASPTALPDQTMDTTLAATTSSALADGSNWYLHIRAVDSCGNWNPTAYHVGPFLVDTTDPLVSEVNPSGIVTTSNVTVTWTASDATSGVARNEISVDGGAFRSLGVQASTTLLLEDGPHLIAVRAVDEAGNFAEAETRLRVDTNVFSLSGPYSGIPTYIMTAAIAVVVALLVIRRRGRKRRSPPTTRPE